jgi:hypothetical protein
MSMTMGLGLRELSGTSEVNLIYSGRDLFGSGFFLPIAHCLLPDLHHHQRLVVGLVGEPDKLTH